MCARYAPYTRNSELLVSRNNYLTFAQPNRFPGSSTYVCVPPRCTSIPKAHSVDHTQPTLYREADPFVISWCKLGHGAKQRHRLRSMPATFRGAFPSRRPVRYIFLRFQAGVDHALHLLIGPKDYTELTYSADHYIITQALDPTNNTMS
jgi:hypothetical protein